MSSTFWFRTGAVMGFLAVALGAFGAHGLRDWLPTDRKVELLETFKTGVQYQMYHALGLLALGLWTARSGTSTCSSIAGWGFLIGIVLFSGSLYGLVLNGPRWLGPITPIGGVAFLVGWVALAIAAGRAGGIATGP